MTIRSRLGNHGCCLILLLVCLVWSCKSPSTSKFVSIDNPVIALEHIRVIDGTGGPPREDQTILIYSGRIVAIGPTAETSVPTSATVLELTGHTAMPGLVGMHNHLFYVTDRGKGFVAAKETFAPLYPSTNIADVRNVQTVFKDGVGYDSAKLIESMLVGEK